MGYIGGSLWYTFPSNCSDSSGAIFCWIKIPNWSILDIWSIFLFSQPTLRKTCSKFQVLIVLPNNLNHPCNSSEMTGFRALQRHPVDTHDYGTHRSDIHGGQWGHFRHLQTAPQDQQPHLHQSEQTHIPGRLIHHCFTTIPRYKFFTAWLFQYIDH